MIDAILNPWFWYFWYLSGVLAGCTCKVFHSLFTRKQQAMRRVIVAMGGTLTPDRDTDPKPTLLHLLAVLALGPIIWLCLGLMFLIAEFDPTQE